MKEIQFTINDLRLLVDICNSDGKITFRTQSIYQSQMWFYRAMGKLKKNGLIEKEYIISDKINRRICIYHLTLKGYNLVRMVC